MYSESFGVSHIGLIVCQSSIPERALLTGGSSVWCTPYGYYITHCSLEPRKSQKLKHIFWWQWQYTTRMPIFLTVSKNLSRDCQLFFSRSPHGSQAENTWKFIFRDVKFSFFHLIMHADEHECMIISSVNNSDVGCRARHRPSWFHMCSRASIDCSKTRYSSLANSTRWRSGTASIGNTRYSIANHFCFIPGAQDWPNTLNSFTTCFTASQVEKEKGKETLKKRLKEIEQKQG